MLQPNLFFISHLPNGMLWVQILDEDDLGVFDKEIKDPTPFELEGVLVTEKALQRAQRLPKGRGEYITDEGAIWDPIGQRITEAA